MGSQAGIQDWDAELSGPLVACAMHTSICMYAAIPERCPRATTRSWQLARSHSQFHAGLPCCLGGSIDRLTAAGENGQ